MVMRSVVIQGPLTDLDLLDLIKVMRRIEKASPTETFNILIDDPESTMADSVSILDKLPPPAPGYGRTAVFIPRPLADDE